MSKVNHPLYEEHPNIYLPARIKVLRLFRKDEISNQHFDPEKVPLESDSWKLFKKQRPFECNIFYVKSVDGKKVAKAFYLHQYYLGPVDCYWYHITKNEYIPNDNIGSWMPIYNTTDIV